MVSLCSEYARDMLIFLTVSFVVGEMMWKMLLWEKEALCDVMFTRSICYTYSHMTC